MKFQPGDKVRKISGGKWRGTVVGTYSTELTPEGYAVESSAETGSVQIYPAKALEAWDGEAEGYTAVDMATARAEGFRDGQAAVEPAPAQDEPLYVTHRPLIRNAIGLLRMRRPVTPDAQKVIDDLEAMLIEMPTPSAPAEAHWLEVAEVASHPEQSAPARKCHRAVSASDGWFCGRDRGHAGECGNTAPRPEQGGLVEALEACRSELHSMIERHNKQSVADGSWLYDHQTVAEADAALAAYRAALSAQGGQ